MTKSATAGRPTQQAKTPKNSQKTTKRPRKSTKSGIVPKEEFAKRMLLLEKRSEKFQATAYYDSDGDCIEFLASPKAFYAERVDDLITVYYSEETDEVVGSFIKGVSKFCNEILEKMPGFKIEIHAGRVKLEHFFRLRLWSLNNTDPQDMPTLIYRKLIDVAEESNVETENLDLAFV